MTIFILPLPFLSVPHPPSSLLHSPTSKQRIYLVSLNILKMRCSFHPNSLNLLIFRQTFAPPNRVASKSNAQPTQAILNSTSRHHKNESRLPLSLTEEALSTLMFLSSLENFINIKKKEREKRQTKMISPILLTFFFPPFFKKTFHALLFIATRLEEIIKG